MADPRERPDTTARRVEQKTIIEKQCPVSSKHFERLRQCYIEAFEGDEFSARQAKSLLDDMQRELDTIMQHQDGATTRQLNRD